MFKRNYDKLAAAADHNVKERDFWKERLAGSPDKSYFPYDGIANSPAPDVPGAAMNIIEPVITPRLNEQLKKLSKGSDVKIHMVMTAGLTALLEKYTGNRDITIGSPIYKQEVIQDFVNTVLVLRNRLEENITFKELLLSTRKTIIDSTNHQNYPIEILLDQLNISYGFDGSDFPLFDVAVINEALHDKSYMPHDYIGYNILFAFRKTGDDVEARVEYNSLLYEKSSIERIFNHYTTLLEELISHPDAPLEQVDFFPEAEKKEILEDFNCSQTEYPRDKTLHQLFEEQAETSPDRIAVANSEERISYAELNKKAGQLAGILNEKGIMPGTIAAIMIEPCIEMMIGIMGILKAGAAYLPIDMQYPEERVRFMLEDSGAGVLVSWLNGLKVRRLNGSSEPANKPTNLQTNEPTNVAYIIYTSGTTGQPKGVMVEHSNAVAYVHSFYHEFNLTSDDIFLQQASFAFDVFVEEVYPILLTGGRSVMVQREVIMAIDRLSDFMLKQGITIISCSPLLLNEINNLPHTGSIRIFINGGDVLKREYVSNLLKTGGVYNTYGPTESTVCATYYRCSQDTPATPPIGKPIANYSVHILGKDSRLLPIGVPGELCVSGAGVSRGYLNRPELTNEKFELNTTLYHTGDLARWMPDGNVEFLGRIDHQVKIRGYRIELGEIENRLLTHPGIKDAVVVVKENETDDRFLAAYLVPAGEEEIASTLLMAHLSGHLPDYMIPTYFVSLQRFPLTATGKVDRKMLPEPEVNRGRSYVAPRDEIEERLAGIWSEVLGVEDEDIGIDSDFFQLGGFSWKATLLVSKMHHDFNVRVPLTEVFRAPTIRELSGFIKGAAADEYVSIEPVEKRDYYPLSSAQRRIFLLQQMDISSTVYNMSQVIPLTQDTDSEKLLGCLEQLIARHESLRTSFHIVDDRPVQKIQDHVEFGIGRGVPPWSPLNGNNCDVNNNHSGSHGGLPLQSFLRPFDLTHAPLMRAWRVTMEDGNPRLVLDMHHIITDGVSQEILMAELATLYQGGSLPPLELQYKDFARWQTRPEYQELLTAQETYWLKIFPDEPPVLLLPVDYPRPPVQSFQGNRVRFGLNQDQSNILNTLAKGANTTLYMVILSVFTLLLSKLSGQDDIIVGTPVAGRRHTQLERIAGMFVNTLALRNTVNGEKTFRQFLLKVVKRGLEAFENQEYPFEDLVEEVSINRDAGRNPLFDVMFSLVNGAEEAGGSSRHKEENFHRHREVTAKFDLTLTAIDMRPRLVFTLEYCTKLFKPATIERIITYFKTVVNALSSQADREIAAVEITTSEEKHRILNEFNDTRCDYPHDKTVHQLFEEQVEKNPASIAVVDRDRQIDYARLNEKADRLAVILNENGVVPGTIAAIMTEPGIEMMIGIMGILKAGAAYLPIDPLNPEERVRFMVRDSGARVFVSTGLVVKRLDGSSEPPHKPINQQTIKPTHLAYIIYTSGTTGQPKGTLIRHQSLTNLCHWHNKQFNVTPLDRATKYAGFGFDASVWETFPYFVAGASLYIVPDSIKSDVEQLNSFYEQYGITISFLPTQMCQLFMAVENRSLRVLLTGGDKLLTYTPRSYRVVNNYGPTENTVVSTSISLDGDYTGTNTDIPIGKPIANTTLYILNPYYQLQPIGAAGECCLSGVGLALGYLNQPVLTAEKFKKRGSELVYHTGDLARWLEDGNVQFLGRIDQQVKIRGFRIELGEIETQLSAMPDVIEAVVVDRDDSFGDKYLCAYIVGVEGVALKIKERLTRTLPDYMVPGYVVQLEKVPLTLSGKIDKQALPEPQQQSDARFAAPRNQVEEQLVEIWQEVLGISPEPGQSRIGIDDDFFQLGGHSLRATIMVSKIHKRLGLKLPLMEVFRNPTIRGLAPGFEGLQESTHYAIEAVEKKDYYALSSAQKRLYFLQQLDPQSTSYNIPYVFPIGKELELKRLETALKQLIARHESLRSSFEKLHNIPVQRVYDDPAIAFSMDRYEVDNNTEAEEIVSRYTRPFDLSQAPLFRSGIIKLPGGDFIWLADVHHIVSDGTSMGVLTRDFLALYSGQSLPEIDIQYKDFSEWQNRLFETGVIKAQEDYWLDLYHGEIPRLELPVDYKRPEVFTFAGANYRFTIDPGDTAAFRELGTRSGGTLYMNVLALLNTLFYKYSGQTDIVIGTGIAGRPHADLQQLIGMFVNTLAMRNRPDGKKPYDRFLKEVIQSSVHAFENQDVQFEELVDKLDLERDAARNPLFDIMMVVQNFQGPGPDGSAGENSSRPQFETLPAANENLPDIRRKNTTAKFDLTFYVMETETGVFINIEYYTAIFSKETIARFALHFQRVIRSVIETPSITPDALELLSPEDRRELLEQFNDNETLYPREKTIGQLFEEQVRQTPDRAAVVFGEECVTYKALDDVSNRLANYLFHETRLTLNQPVALLMDRSIAMIIGIFGVLKAGGAYIPLSPSFPEERLKTMIDDTSAPVIIGPRRYIKTLNRLQWECKGLETFLCIDSDAVFSEDEVEESELMSRKLWEYVGETAVDEVTGGGWNSSYTGNPIPKEEMDEYGDNILEKLTPLLRKDLRILEIGAASGISMYRIAPHVGFYYGTDLSSVIVEKNNQRIAEEGHTNIKFSCFAAHEIHRLEEKDFDLVIINSVMQCFNGHNYLRKVIRKALDLMGPEGYLFFGDIMDQDTKEDLIADLTRFKQDQRGQGFKTKTDWSEELFISRGFLEDLSWDYPEVHDMEFSRKIYTIENELTKFRYDALIRIDKDAGKSKKRKPKHGKQHDLRMLTPFETRPLHIRQDSRNLAYIIYTSGSTGTPKGNLTTHHNVTRVVKDTNYIDFRLEDRVLQLSDYAFDGSVFDIYGALLNGSALILVTREELLELEKLVRLLERERISVFFTTTALFNTLVDIGLESLTGTRKILFGGERVSVEHTARAVDYLGKGRVIHVYGPTETTVYASYFPIGEVRDDQITIPIGKPIANTRIYILDPHLNPVPIGINGEIYIGGPGVCQGYLNNEALTAETFLPNPFNEGQIIYRTGDLGRWLPEGSVEFNGRIDHQVKVRGYRIELGEIESRLLNYQGVVECTVTAREDEKGSRYLCAYMVGDGPIDVPDLKDELFLVLPEFMIPAYFIQLEKLPLKSTGKIDTSKLPDPLLVLDKNFIAPRDGLETKLVDIWAEVLGVKKEIIGRDSNFFQLGGHSLKATVLTSKVHKELNVKLPLAEIFNRQTVKELSRFIRDAAIDQHSSIEPAEEKEYYPLSAAQKRLYIIQQMDLESTRYNMPYRIPLGKEVEPGPIEETFRKLIHRHESLRTSFHMIDETPVQKIHDHVPFSIQPVRLGQRMGQKSFDLSQVPLFRAGLRKSDNGMHMLLVEMHHIISDGTSQGILEREFAALYREKEPAPLALQYKDFSQWQNSQEQQQFMQAQETYWLKEFSGELPVLDLPSDYTRPLVQHYEGRELRFYIGEEVTAALLELCLHTESTLYMVLLAACNVLLSKLSRQEDIIIGTPVAARKHADLQDIIGMFVNTLAVRNTPFGHLGFKVFLKQVKERTLDVFENQDYPFEELVDKTSVKRDTGRHPVFDVLFNFLNQADVQLNVSEADYDEIVDTGTAKANFDLTFQGTQVGDVIYFTLSYGTSLYKSETVERFITYFKNILSEITRTPGTRLSTIDYIPTNEKERLIIDFNRTDAAYPEEATIHGLFEEQVERNPNQVALVGGNREKQLTHVTYNELNRRAEGMVRLLMEKGVEPGVIAAVMLERSLDFIVGILGILKAGGAYLPIDPGYPHDRVQYMLKD
ncbi:MAG: amino acid adenylation domain-containing protein, partial [bacterium]|nr:amino acid adenylation domain-containing protein [bacterium]